MAKRRVHNSVRTDYLEAQIAHYRACGDHSAADAIERLANSVGAPISQDKIDKEVAQRARFYRHIRHGGSGLDDIDECAVCTA